MSERHREALAHLVFGVGESGGFVLLTGEVGTGKTTVCRCLLEQLPQNTDIAFILNPKLTAVELLQTLCDDLGLEYEAVAETKTPSMKRLNDVLNIYLLKAHSEGRHTVLLIDEAQNLAAEVLEQIRLLTNLETNEKKLLQIILIGQPELKQMLQQNELRQLSQRITARYHLEPLALEETAGYINYRLAVAGSEKMIFSLQSIAVIHKLSQGIPRIINTICDRSLLGAYSRGSKVVDSQLIKQAAREVLGDKWRGKYPPAAVSKERVATKHVSLTKIVLWLFLLLAGVGLGMIFSYLVDNEPPKNIIDSVATNKQKSSTNEKSKALKNKLETTTEQWQVNTDFLTEIATFAMPYQQALNQLSGLWGVESVEGCADLAQQHFRCELEQGNWGQVLAFDRPAMLAVMVAGERNFILINKASASDAQLVNTRLANGQLKTFSKSQLESIWSGEFSFIWLPPAGYISPLKLGDSGLMVQWLEQQLLHITQPNLAKDSIIPTTIRFDEALGKQLQKFQQNHGLNADGVAGLRTIMLINQLLHNNLPRLSVVTPQSSSNSIKVDIKQQTDNSLDKNGQ